MGRFKPELRETRAADLNMTQEQFDKHYPFGYGKTKAKPNEEELDPELYNEFTRYQTKKQDI